MAAISAFRRSALALLLATTLAASLGTACSAHATPRVQADEAADVEAIADTDPLGEAVRFRFWIGPFEFSVTLGGESPFALSFEGLR